MKLKIRDLYDGDGVDLLTFPPGYEFDDATRMYAESQLAELVRAGDDLGPFTRNTSGRWVLHTSLGDFGVDPDWVVEVNRPEQ